MVFERFQSPPGLRTLRNAADEGGRWGVHARRVAIRCALPRFAATRSLVSSERRDEARCGARDEARGTRLDRFSRRERQCRAAACSAEIPEVPSPVAHARTSPVWRALDATPRAVLACGPITRVDSAVTTPGRPQIEPYRGFASDDDFTRRADLVSVLTMGDPASLGVLFRGVQRAALLPWDE